VKRSCSPRWTWNSRSR